MALSEGDDESPSSQDNSTTATDANQTGAAASGGDSGPRNGHSPIASSDYFSELPQNMDLSSPNTQAVLGSIGERVTSVTGSPSLDLISSATASRTVSSPDRWPETYVPSDTTATVHSTSNLVASEVLAAARETSHTASGNTDLEMSTFVCAPPLSMTSLTNDDSLNHSMDSVGPWQDQAETSAHVDLASSPDLASESPVTCHTYQESLKGLDLSECSGAEKSTETAKTVSDTDIPQKHFGENSEFLVSQQRSSGYESFGTATKDSKKNEKFHGHKNAVSNSTHCASNRSSNHSSLQISDAGINTMICAAGTQTSPVFPEYSSLLSRLTSFPRRFRLWDDVEVNRDLLALAGFYYSGWDTVTCYHCGCSPRVWGDGRYPETEHRLLVPYCKALLHQ